LELESLIIVEAQKPLSSKLELEKINTKKLE
jgi:hypothetical protein